MSASLGASLALYPVVAVAGGVSMRRFARVMLPPQLLALSTSSSIAVLPALVEAAEQQLDIEKKVSGFVLPLAASTFKPAAPVSWTVGTLFVAWFYGVTLHLPQLAIVAGAAVFLSFAGPGVPRGAFIMLAPLLTAVGLPAEGVGLLIAVDAIPDTCSTVLNVTGDMAAAAIVHRRMSEPRKSTNA
ncbi:MAG: cation:dicarboxylase symporter family transporter [Gemmatimonadaceae bacterium]